MLQITQEVESFRSHCCPQLLSVVLVSSSIESLGQVSLIEANNRLVSFVWCMKSLFVSHRLRDASAELCNSVSRCSGGVQGAVPALALQPVTGAGALHGLFLEVHPYSSAHHQKRPNVSSFWDCACVSHAISCCITLFTLFSPLPLNPKGALLLSYGSNLPCTKTCRIKEPSPPCLLR